MNWMFVLWLDITQKQCTMKRLSFFILMIVCLVSVHAQKIEMIEGKPIKIEEITEGFNKGAVYYYQDDVMVKPLSVMRTLEALTPENENILLCKKHRKTAITCSIIGLVTFPVGYLILVVPIINNKKKEGKYLMLAVEDYNNSLL